MCVLVADQGLPTERLGHLQLKTLFQNQLKPERLMLQAVQNQSSEFTSSGIGSRSHKY